MYNRQYAKETAREILNNTELVLKITRIPNKLYYINLRTKQPKIWKTIRQKMLKTHNKCVICGAKKDLDIHEEWSYDYDNGIAKIVALKPICKLCHGIIHINRTSQSVISKLPLKAKVNFFDDNEYWDLLETQINHWYEVNGFNKIKLDISVRYHLWTLHQNDLRDIAKQMLNKNWIVDWNSIKKYLE